MLISSSSVSFFLHSYHLHFHVNTWIKGSNQNKVKCFFLHGQDATTIKVTFMHCCSGGVSTASCFRVSTLKPLGPGQSTQNGDGAFELRSNHWNHPQILGQPAVESWQPFRDWLRDLRSRVCHCLTVRFHGFILTHRSGKRRITVVLPPTPPAVSFYGWLVRPNTAIVNPK